MSDDEEYEEIFEEEEEDGDWDDDDVVSTDDDEDDAGSAQRKSKAQPRQQHRARRSDSAGPDLYEVLGIARDAAQDEIARAYRRQALLCHPDRNPDGAETFKKLSAAYEVLNDAQKRKMYDRT